MFSYLVMNTNEITFLCKEGAGHKGSQDLTALPSGGRDNAVVSEYLGSRADHMSANADWNVGSYALERIEWDEYFMSIAVLAACRSPCQRLHVGSVVVKDKRIVAMGYNGFLPGCKHESHIRDGHEQATIHSEMISITDCAKRGISMDKSSIYITHYPCLNCFKALCASGVTEIVYLDDYNNDPLVAKMAGEAEVKIRKQYQVKKTDTNSI